MSTTRRARVSWLLGLVLVAGLAGGVGLTAPPGSASIAEHAHADAPAKAAKPAIARIRADWTSFFAGSTPVTRKIALLQNGGRFAAVLRSQSASPIARTTSARVTSVRLTSRVTALVRYTISLAGSAVLKNVSGKAVLQRGTWKVGDVSFCGLLRLEQVKAPACPARTTG